MEGSCCLTPFKILCGCRNGHVFRPLPTARSLPRHSSTAHCRHYSPLALSLSSRIHRTKPIGQSSCRGLVQPIFSSPARLRSRLGSAYTYCRRAAKLKMLCISISEAPKKMDGLVWIRHGSQGRVGRVKITDPSGTASVLNLQHAPRAPIRFPEVGNQNFVGGGYTLNLILDHPARGESLICGYPRCRPHSLKTGNIHPRLPSAGFWYSLSILRCHPPSVADATWLGIIFNDFQPLATQAQLFRLAFVRLEARNPKPGLRAFFPSAVIR